MGTDALTEYQQLGEKLDAAADVVRAARKRKPRGGGMVKINVEPGSASSEAIAETPVLAADAPATAAEPAVAEVEPAGVEVDSGEVLPDGPVVAAETEAAAAVDLAALEALIFASRHPLTPAQIGEFLVVPAAKALRAAVAELNRQYEGQGRSFRIEQVAGGYQMLTLPSYGPMLLRFHQRDIDSKLSRSALETLSIIAYKQPVLRAEIESIRGVASGETIRSLMEKHLVKIAARAEIAGRPMLYGTTRRFLEVFGLTSLKELPKEENARPVRPVAERPVVETARLEVETARLETDTARLEAETARLETDTATDVVPQVVAESLPVESGEVNG
jgi:segregation and condensation protein B